MVARLRKWVYAKPLDQGPLTAENFALHEEDLPEIDEGEALVRVLMINIHAGTRNRMLTGRTALGGTDPSNYACARVIRSRDPAFQEGDLIACQAGWQDYAVVRSREPAIGYGPITPEAARLNRTNSQWTYVYRPELAKRWSTDILLDIFGTSGLTAWFGMRECGPLTPADQVLVAAASGSVGSIVAQLARGAGAQVVGLAGGEDRCRWVLSATGIDACLDYRAQDFGKRLEGAFPDGIDLFSDGVGGSLTGTAVSLLKEGGRLFSYGSSAAYYDDTPQVAGSSVRERFGITADIARQLDARSARAECWIVDSFYHERITAEDALAALLEAGVLRPVHTVVQGLDNLPEAICDMYRKPRAGKVQIGFDQ